MIDTLRRGSMKKVSILFICLLMVVSCCFMGCSTFSINDVKFYNETVAVVNDEKITRFDLLNSYNSYGQSYFVTQQGMTEKEALNKTLDLLIDRKLMANYAKNNSTYALTKYDINSVYQNVIDYMDDTFKSYLESARVALNYDAIEDAEEDEAETAYLIEDYQYEKRAVLETGDIIKYVGSDDETINSYALDADFVDNYSSKSSKEIVTKLYAKFIERVSVNKYGESNYSKIYDKAMSLMANNLISYEKYLRDENGKEYSKDTAGLTKRLIERVYKSELESAYISNVEDNYLKTETLSTDKLLKKYKELTESAYSSYENSVEDYYSYLQEMGSNNEAIYYTPTNATARFGYFYHTLIPLESDVLSEINSVKDLKDDAVYDEEAYNREITAILSKATHQARNDEGVLDEEKSVKDILKEYQDYYYGRGVDKFIEFMLKYTSDTATLTASTPYVMGYEGDETYSGMVSEFTSEGVRLMKDNLTATASTEYIITTYGIHLLYYVGDVEAPISYENKNSVCISLDICENNLYYTYINEKTGKTYFDLLFDTVYPASDGSVYSSNNGYTDYETMLIDSLKDDNVTKYVTRINATTKVL